MSIFKLRTAMLCMLAVSLASSLAPTPASATAGPFWHEQFMGEGEGEKIPEDNWLKFQGEGGEQKWKSIIGSEPVEVVADRAQIKGIYYNKDTMQGQVKFDVIYKQPKLVKPALKGCETNFGRNNVIKVFGHLAWKWNGTAKQLKESAPVQQKWDILGTTGDIKEGQTKLPESRFTTLILTGTGCSVLAGQYAIEGSMALETTPENLGEWVRVFTLKLTEGKRKQHYWNGNEAIGMETGLSLAGHEANVTGQIKLTPPGLSQSLQIGVFEK
jgi:hypothetical protein